MKNVYFVLTYTGTLLSKIVKTFTKYEFSHVSISLDIDLNEMYSFGRLRPYNAFIGGFVHENIRQGTFKRFFKTKAKIYSMSVTDEQYIKIRKSIDKIERDKENYKFNILGLFAAGFHKKIGKDHSFYCAEFVKYVLDSANIDIGLPSIIRPEHFQEINGVKEIYSGLLRKYPSSKRKLSEEVKQKTMIYTKKTSIIRIKYFYIKMLRRNEVFSIFCFSED